MKSRLHLALLAVVVVVVAAVVPAPPPASAQQFSVTVTVDGANVRTAPSTSASIATRLSLGDVVGVYGVVDGEDVFGGNSTWYLTRSGWYIYSGVTDAGSSAGQGDVGSTGSSGRRIVVDLSTQIASAVEDGRVVYEAPVTVGTAQFPTPVGTFRVLRRVFNETMDSSTIGIPVNSPGGYYLTGVLYTQYFTNGGAAIHYNYWSPPEAFGNSPGSHGCIGMRLNDSAFFWDFAGVGTPVIINP